MSSLSENVLPFLYRTFVHRAGGVGILSVAVLMLSPEVRAQAVAPGLAPTTAGAGPSAVLPLYTLKISGGPVETLEQELKAAFPKDNVVLAPSAKSLRLKLDGFEIRNARLKELGRTIEFLSEGLLSVEVVESADGAAGNIWRIGTKRAEQTMEGAAANLKMRSVAAPHLFRDKAKAEQVRKDADSMEFQRRFRLKESSGATTGALPGLASMELLPEQHMYVIIGTEDSIAGVESFIKAAEQLAMEEAARKELLAATLAPRMRAVLAPHLFRSESRLEKAIGEFQNVQNLWNDAHASLMKMTGLENPRGGVCVQPRAEQKLFVLLGAEADLAGMESLILAAENNAAVQDAREEQEMKQWKAEQEEAKRKEAEAAGKSGKGE